jgi:hypothetical protein
VLVEEGVHHLMAKELDQAVLVLKVAFYSNQNLPLALGVNYFDDEVLRLSLVQAWS